MSPPPAPVKMESLSIKPRGVDIERSRGLRRPASESELPRGWLSATGTGAPRHSRRGPREPFWAGLIVVVATALAITAMLLVRRQAPAGSYFEDGDRAAGVFGVLATGFAVLLGFVVFLAFESYDTSRSGAEAEAQIVTEQFETAQLFPVAVRARLSGELVCYARTVIHQEWPQMKAGTLGDTAIHGASPRSAPSGPSSRGPPPSRRRTRSGSISAPTARMRAPTAPTAPRG